jgi:hypothetical protein
MADVVACGSVTLTAKPQYFLANKNVASKITAKVIGPDGKPATGTITFTVNSPSPSDNFSNKGTVNISNGIANITFYHYRSDPGIISISAIATITVKAQDGSLQTFNPTGYIVLYALSVEFLKSGTNSVISKAHVGTDGDPATTKDGETKQFDIKILPEDCKLQFVLSNQEADISPKEGNNTTAVTLIGKGSGYSDSELSVQGGDPPNVIVKLPIIIHKPYRVTTKSQNKFVINEGNTIGAEVIVNYRVQDIKGRTISDLGNYRIYERLHIGINRDGVGGPFADNPLKGSTINPFPGKLLSEGTDNIYDSVGITFDRTTTEHLNRNGILRWHNCFYIMDLYMKNSTYQYTFTPKIVKKDVVGVNLNRMPLSDSNMVTQANDDID